MIAHVPDLTWITGCKDAAPGRPGKFGRYVINPLASRPQPALLLLLGNQLGGVFTTQRGKNTAVYRIFHYPYG
jgi:hypothetical protein